MQKTQSELLCVLNKHRKENAFLIRTLENEPFTEQHEYNGSYAVYENRARNWLFSLEHEGDFAELVKQLSAPLETFYINRSDCWDEISAVLPEAHFQKYVQYNLESRMFIQNPAEINPEIEVVPIDKSWTEFILSLYKSEEFGHRDYIDACIDLNPGFGALLNGERIGYVLLHLDGELGSMVICENVRGMGVGKTLMQHITPLYAAQASIGIGFVLPENRASQRMLEKTCFIPLERRIMWVYH